jgi:hypothetical protein
MLVVPDNGSHVLPWLAEEVAEIDLEYLLPGPRVHQ